MNMTIRGNGSQNNGIQPHKAGPQADVAHQLTAIHPCLSHCTAVWQSIIYWGVYVHNLFLVCYWLHM